MKKQKFYSVNQACRIIGVKPYILKHWEKNFDLKTIKNSAGRRIYSDAEVEKFASIRHLLYRDHYTMQGAKRKLEAMRKSVSAGVKKKEFHNTLLFLKRELIALKTQLTAH